jgi:hypothetical protein
VAFRPPKYRLHKGSGQALVQINGERIYLGKYNTEESKEEYRRLVAEFLASEQRPRIDGSGVFGRLPPISINELILTYWRFANSYYLKNGKPAGTLVGIRSALRPLRQLYGGASASDFGPKKLQAIRHQLKIPETIMTRLSVRP